MPELFSPCLGQHQLQPLDFQPAEGHFALRQRQLFTLRNDHRMRSGKVGAKRNGRRRHEDESTIFVAKNPARFNGYSDYNVELTINRRFSEQSRSASSQSQTDGCGSGFIASETTLVE
ncbi:hypothetical protein [Bradyrhizobium yuanmingense]|uniref:hypothetical protein n=1 Tax=Bradyrhizobium yuanmingense TaxID=108015 RepID=UPI003517F744